jgi:tetratricopeptide (TPR) repeat protein
LWDIALKASQALIEKYPGFAWGYDDLGEVYDRTGYTDDAIRAYQQATKLDESSEIAWSNLGELYKKKNYDNQAEYAFSKSISIQEKHIKANAPGLERSVALSSLADTYKDAGRLKDAEKTYLAATDEYAGNPSAWYALARIYIDRLEFEKAALAYHDGMGDKRMSAAWNMVESILFDEGKDDYAMKCYRFSEQLKSQGR